MFDIGFSEIVVIFGLALVVLGPDKLPKVAANIGRWVGRARAMARQFTDQLQQEASNLKTEADNLKADVHVDLGAFPSMHDPKPAAADAPATPVAAAVAPVAAAVAPSAAHPVVEPVVEPVARPVDESVAAPVAPAAKDPGNER